MSICEFFEIDTVETHSNQLSMLVYKTPWCSHAHSPAPFVQINLPDLAPLLMCDGDSTHCQVRKHNNSCQ